MSLFVFNQQTLDRLSTIARSSDRLRTHHNLHDDPDDKCQRMLVAIEPGSYVQPHRHLRPSKPELLTILRGSIAVLTFNDLGQIEQSIVCEPDQQSIGCDIPSGVWHSIVCLKSETVFLEAKPGPYERLIPEDFAPWSPAENEQGATEFLDKLVSNIASNSC